MAKKQVKNLFDVDEVIKLGEFWVKKHEWRNTGDESMDAYYNGIAQGVEFMIMLLERTGD